MNRSAKTVKDTLTGRVAIVTGGSVGIGLSAALALGRAGADIVVVGRNKSRLDNALAQINHASGTGECLGLALDVRQESDMQQMAERTLERFGRIDILVCAAGILRAEGGALKTLSQMSVADWHAVMDTNLRGIFLSNRSVIKTMIEQRSGNIINVSSTSGRKGLAFDSAYCASKFGVIGLTEALAEELRQFGIRVQILLPGAIDTGMWDQNGPLPPPSDILNADRVADLIVQLTALPEDVMLDAPLVEPLKMHSKIGRLGI